MFLLSQPPPIFHVTISLFLTFMNTMGIIKLKKCFTKESWHHSFLGGIMLLGGINLITTKLCSRDNVLINIKTFGVLVAINALSYMFFAVCYLPYKLLKNAIHGIQEVDEEDLFYNI